MKNHDIIRASRSLLLRVAPPCALSGGFAFAACEAREPPPPEADPIPGWVSSRPFPNIRSLNDVDVAGADETHIVLAYAVGTDGAILRYDGATWQDESPGISEDLEGVSVFVDSEGVETVLAVGESGVVLQRFVTGDVARWGILTTPTDKHLFGVWVANAEDAFIVGDRGTVIRWDGTLLTELVDELLIDTETTDPETGAAIFFAISDPLKSVQGRSPDDVWTVGPRGVIYHFDGTAFFRDVSETNRPLTSVFVESGLWASATDGVLLRRRDDGWKDQDFVAPAPVFLQSIWSRGDGDVFAVGLAEDIYHNENGLWTLTFVEDEAQLRALDGAELPRPADAPEDFVTLREVITVGAGGRIVRGPVLLPNAGETLLTTRPQVIEEEE